MDTQSALVCALNPKPGSEAKRPYHAMQTGRVEFLKRTLIVVAVALVPILIWYLFGVILMAFGAVIVAMLVRLGAQPFMRWLSVPEALALIISGILIVIVIGGAGYLFGSRIVDEFQDVVQRVASGWADIQSRLQGSDFGHFLLGHLSSSDVSVTGVLSGLLKVSTSFFEAVVIMVISAAYLAAQPRLYRDGLIWLFPPRARGRAAEVVDGVGEALRLWLLGQLIEMFLIGTLTTLAVWIIGVPSPLALGLIAGIGEFIPYLGPFLAAIPAILVAITKSPEAVVWTGVAYLVIHQIEGNIVAPLIQGRMVHIPPAVMLIGIVSITYLFGRVAIIFAGPIVVVIFAAVSLLYVRDTLGEKTALTDKLR
jgi:predicted PurR-regulated permease PerM